MSIKKTRKIAVLGLTLALLAMSGITAFANSYTYQNYLPAWRGDITLVGGGAEKSNKGSTAAKNEISELGNDNSFAMCWVDNMSSGGRVLATKQTKCSIRSERWLPYETDSAWTGKVELRSHASNWGFQDTWIKGDVNFG